MADELRLPDLSPETYEEIFLALRDAIPTFSSNWTDYNASDPGITLLQLLSWIAEGTYYRIDRVSDESYRNFVLLAAGVPEQGVEQALKVAQRDVVRRDNATISLGGQPVLLDPAYVTLLQYLLASSKRSPDAAELHAEAQRFWASPYQAVTAKDFEALALQCTASVPDNAPMDKVLRALVRRQEAGVRVTLVSGYTPPYVLSYVKSYTDPSIIGTLSLIPLPPSFSATNGYDKLVYSVGEYLARRKLIGTAVTVEQPLFTPLVGTVDVVIEQGYDVESVLRQAAARIVTLADPLKGGSSGDGWPYGQPLEGYDLVGALRDLPGVDPSFPVIAQVEQRNGLLVGESNVGEQTIVVAPPYTFGFPWFLSLKIRAAYSTWTIQVGVHGRIDLDTRLPLEEDT